MNEKDLDRIIKACLENRPEAGGLYVQRGDYNIISSEGSIISPTEFSETVKAGMQVEMSIIKRTFHAWREHRAQSDASPPESAKAREWFIWYVNMGIDYPMALNGFVSAPILRVDGNMKSTSIMGK